MDVSTPPVTGKSPVITVLNCQSPAAEIDADGAIKAVNFYWRESTRNILPVSFITGDIGYDYFNFLVEKAERHNIFAVKIIEAFQSLWENEFDAFEIIIPADNLPESGEAFCRMKLIRLDKSILVRID